jgi:hypothetical protein
MSKEEDKIKAATRRYNEEVKIAKQVKIAKSHGMDVKEPHKLAKHHALDCGQPGCVMCGNPRKTFKEKTVQEKSFEQTGKWDTEND